MPDTPLAAMLTDGACDVVLPAGTGAATARVEFGATADEETAEDGDEEGSTPTDALMRGGRDSREIGTNETAELELSELEGVALTSLDPEEIMVTKAVGLAEVASVLLLFPADEDPGAAVASPEIALRILWKAVPEVPLLVEELFEEEAEAEVTPSVSTLEVEAEEVEFMATVVDVERGAEAEAREEEEVTTFPVGN